MLAAKDNELLWADTERGAALAQQIPEDQWQRLSAGDENKARLYAKFKGRNGCHHVGAPPPVAGVGGFFTIRRQRCCPGTSGYPVALSCNLSRLRRLKCVKSRKGPRLYDWGRGIDPALVRAGSGALAAGTS